MPKLHQRIRQLVAEGKYAIGQHATERLEERARYYGMAGGGGPVDDGELLVERTNAKPNPVVEIRECLPDGTEFKAVWSLLRQSGVAKLVTVHFFDGD